MDFEKDLHEVVCKSLIKRSKETENEPDLTVSNFFADMLLLEMAKESMKTEKLKEILNNFICIASNNVKGLAIIEKLIQVILVKTFKELEDDKSLANLS